MSCPLPYQDLEPTEVLPVLRNPTDYLFPAWELFAVFFGNTGVHCTPGVLYLLSPLSPLTMLRADASFLSLACCFDSVLSILAPQERNIEV